MAQRRPRPLWIAGELAAEECEALVATWANMEELTSGSSETALDINVSNVPGLPMDSIEMQVDRTAQFNVDQALVDKFMELQAMDPADLAAMVADPDEYAALVAELIAGLDTQQNLRFTFSEELAGQISEAAGLDVPPEVQLNLILKDGTLYIFLDDIMGLVPNIPPLLRGWVGLDVQPLIDLACKKRAQWICLWDRKCCASCPLAWAWRVSDWQCNDRSISMPM